MTFKALRILSLVIFVLFGVAAVFGDQGLIRLYRLQKVQKRLQKNYNELETKNRALLDEVQRLKASSDLERVIRQELNMMPKDEVVFILKD